MAVASPMASPAKRSTEWTFWQTSVDLRWMANQKKSDGYRVVVHHTNNEPAGDVVFELLKAKYGEPKKSEDVDKGKMHTFSKGGRTVRAWRVSEQWQLNVTK